MDRSCRYPVTGRAGDNRAEFPESGHRALVWRGRPPRRHLMKHPCCNGDLVHADMAAPTVMRFSEIDAAFAKWVAPTYRRLVFRPTPAPSGL